jgi:hypothetical protein
MEDVGFSDEGDSGSLLVHYKFTTKNIVLHTIGIIHGSRSNEEGERNTYAFDLKSFLQTAQKDVEFSDPLEIAFFHSDKYFVVNKQ